MEPVGTPEQEGNDHGTDHDQEADVIELDEPEGAISFEPLAGCHFFQGDPNHVRHADDASNTEGDNCGDGPGKSSTVSRRGHGNT